VRYSELPESNAAPASAIKPTTKKPKIPLPGVFTTYTAYGITEIMYKECGSKADYSMPDVKDDADMPQTDEGEDLGVGETWWHTGESFPNSSLGFSNISQMSD
jgi:cytochrome b pre-mRNA-processing protein 3